jgi:hypothetical protein
LRYKGQDNFLQVDSHTHFEKGWDTKLKEIWQCALKETDNQKTVVSGYLPAYTRKDGLILKNDNVCGYSVFAKMYTCMDWNKISWIDLPLGKISKEITKNFVPALKVSGTFILSDHQYANYSGHLHNMKFFDEEIIQSIELFSNGFALAFPNIDIPILHYYSDTNRQSGRATLTEMEQSIDTYISENPHKCKMWEDYAHVNLKDSSFQKWYIPNTYGGR